MFWLYKGRHSSTASGKKFQNHGPSGNSSQICRRNTGLHSTIRALSLASVWTYDSENCELATLRDSRTWLNQSEEAWVTGSESKG